MNQKTSSWVVSGKFISNVCRKLVMLNIKFHRCRRELNYVDVMITCLCVIQFCMSGSPHPKKITSSWDSVMS